MVISYSKKQISAYSDKIEIIGKFVKIHICKWYPNKMKVPLTVHMLERSSIMRSLKTCDILGVLDDIYSGRPALRSASTNLSPVS